MEFEWLRLFLEHRGFCTRAISEVSGGKRGPLHGFTLLEFFRSNNSPASPQSTHETDFYLYSKNLVHWTHGVVLVRPWHTWQHRPERLKSSADFFRLIEKNLHKEFALSEISAPLVLLLPGAPSAEPWKTRLREHLQSLGIQAVISLRALLHEIIQQNTPSLSQGETGHHQSLDWLRLLRFYDLLKDPQMELFS